MSDENRNNSIEKLFDKFKNGRVLYRESAMFNRCFNVLLRGGSPYECIEELCISIQKQDEQMLKVVQNQPFKIEALIPVEEIKDINFLKWYSGMEEAKIRKAYERYKKEILNNG